MINIVFVLGGPGSGKGTLCQDLQKEGWIHMSLGDLLREKAKKDTKIEAILQGGNLVSSELAVQTILEYLNSLEDNSKVLVDGFPRNESNWEEWLQQDTRNIQIHQIIFLETTKEMMFKRVIKRANQSEEKRSDDKEEVFENRYNLYLESLKVLQKPELKSILSPVDSNGTPQETLEVVLDIFKTLQI